jgi:heat shock protein HspQ
MTRASDPLDLAIAGVPIPPVAHARFNLGEVVRHRLFDFRGVIFDIDPVFANTDEWYEAIPEDVRPRKDQPFYTCSPKTPSRAMVAYVSQQNLSRTTASSRSTTPRSAGCSMSSAMVATS